MGGGEGTEGSGRWRRRQLTAASASRSDGMMRVCRGSGGPRYLKGNNFLSFGVGFE